VQYPLRRLYGDDYRVAPLSVMVDPMRAARMVGLDTGRAFSPKVQYIYEKQLEEADIIVVNKSDLLTAERRHALSATLRTRFPQAAVVAASARTGENLDGWFNHLSGTIPSRPAMEVDYDTYAEGEALLGWYNATCRVSSSVPFDGNQLLQQLASRVQHALAAQGLEVAHFKMTLAPDTGNDLAVLNLVTTEGRAELPHRLADALTSGELIVNLRAEGDPDELRTIAAASLADASRESRVDVHVEHSESFRPGRPVPTHRMATP
jgi:archaeosine-15-forming tRNA-guanine transglycosylase